MDLQRRAPKKNPISEANFFSKHFLVWFWPIFSIGYKRTITVDDLWDPAEEDQAGVTANQLESWWNKRNDNVGISISARDPEQIQMLPNNNVHNQCKQEDTPNERNADGDYKQLLTAICDAFGTKYFLVWPLLIITDCGLKVFQPWFMLLLVRTFIEESHDETSQYLYAAGVCLTTFLITLTTKPCQFYLGRLSQRCRIALASLIQRKILRLHASSRLTDLGEITTLISNDTSTLETNLPGLPYLLVAPMQLIILFCFLWAEFGLSSLPGVICIALFAPFQYIYGSLSIQYKKDISKKTEERSRVLAEVIDAIQSVKIYVWEDVFQGILQKCRKEEVLEIRKRSRLHAFQMSVFLTSSRLIPFLTFTAFVFLGGPLTADRVFYAVAVFNTMTHYALFMFPSGVRAVGEIIGSLQRIHKFLQLPEKPLNQNKYVIDPSQPTPNIIMENVSASWYSDNGISESLTLSNLKCKGSKLVVVVGQVACGKTSLLNLILNELHIIRGSVEIDGSLSYAPQESKLFPGSIRANILNGAEFNEGRYKQVLKAACLEEVIQQKEDMTRVAGLSGGQKARVNLARALYHEANIYLLDDPLSAVDAGVSRKIFENAIQKFLGNTLRILVTNQLDYLEEADHVIVMDQRTIVGQGSYSDIKATVIHYLGKRTDASVDVLMARGAGALNALSAVNEDAGADQNTTIDIPKDGKEIQKEGALGLKIYWKYFMSGRSLSQLTTYLLIFFISQIFTTLIEYWLALWTNAEEKMYEASLAMHHGSVTGPAINSTDIEHNSTFTWQGFEHFLSNLDNLEQNYYLYTYLILTAIVFLSNLAKAIGFFQYCIRISTIIHEKMLKCLLGAQPSFFDDNPSGRIMNRFTKDMKDIDEQIPFNFFDMWTIYLQVGTVIILIIFAIWYSVVPIAIFLLLLGYVRRYYVATSRDLKRIEGTTRSPVLIHAQATFNALVTMRALGAEKILSRQFDYLQDVNTSSTISFLAATQCFNIWIETLATVLLTSVAFGFLLAQNYLGMSFLSGNVGLAICSAMSLTIWLQYGMTVSATVENLMISVERALEYTKLESEVAPNESFEKPPEEWPNAGDVKFENVYLSYGKVENLNEATLKGISFDIKPREKIGIVGQTGAGKSSVFRALFRMNGLLDGRIIVDGKDIQRLDLQDLRKSMVIIPQEPKLFKGTLMFNLDPRIQLETKEEKLNQTSSQMQNIIRQIGFDKTLNFTIDDKGANLSVGERYLVSIMRALFHRKRIVCLDEATAHIDQGTDKKIQELLRDTLTDSTTITIAHRLGTVIESDRILVLHEGKQKEYDHPYRLLQNPEGWLKRMVESTGAENACELENRATESWKRHNQGGPS